MAFVDSGQMANYTKTQFDQFLTNLINEGLGFRDQVIEAFTFVNAHPDGDFTAAVGAGVGGPVGYSASDIAVIRSAVTRLKAYADIGNGTVAQGATAENFWTFPNQLVSGIR